MQPVPPPDEFATPFIVSHQRRDQTPGGYFRPAANVQLTPLLRTSGLLAALPGDDVKSLLFVLSFVTPNGRIAPSVLELAQAMRLSEPKTRSRLQRLARPIWQGRPLLAERRRDNGLDAFTPLPHLLAMRHEPAADMLHSPSLPPQTPAGGRDAVIAHSRAAYARPRAEVEAEIARLNGWEYPFVPLAERPVDAGAVPREDERTAALRREMRALSMAEDTVSALLNRYEGDVIVRQLAWLPYRHAKEPARFLYSAVVHDYAMPTTLHNRERLEEGLAALPTPSEYPSPRSENSSPTA